jgi:K+-transporting ATPase KdpF subunit
MIADYIVTGAVSAGLLAYLLFALLNPDRF